MNNQNRTDLDPKQMTHGGRFNIVTGEVLGYLDRMIHQCRDPETRKYLVGVQDGIKQASDIFFKTREET